MHAPRNFIWVDDTHISERFLDEVLYDRAGCPLVVQQIKARLDRYMLEQTWRRLLLSLEPPTDASP